MSPLPKTERVFNACCDHLERQFPDVGAVELHLDEAAGSDNGAGSDRQFAYCKDGDPIIIAFASKVEKLPLSHIKGLMRHEFGHALEYRYGVADLERKLRKKLPSGSERRADAIAETVWGETIRYDSKDIQCVGAKGRSPRPGHLAKNTSGTSSPFDNPAFVEWFGGSVVKDGRGQPLVVYHGAPDAAGIFRYGFQKSMMRGHSYFAVDSAAVARTYADAHRVFDYQAADPGVIPLYLSIQRPLVLDAAGETWKGTEAWAEKARASGHDGLIIRRSRDTYNDSEKAPLSTVYVWFSPTQAKSAARGQVMQSGKGAIRGEPIAGSGPNSGAFSPHDPRIRKNAREPQYIEQCEGCGEDVAVYTRLDKLEERFKKGLPPNRMQTNPPTTLPAGTAMFHGTLESLRGRLQAGGDGLLWFADCPAIAQLYLARSGMRMWASPEHLKDPSQDKLVQKIQEQLGFVFSAVDWDDFGRLQSWARPEGWDHMPTKEEVVGRLKEMGYEPKRGGVFELLMHDGELLPARGYVRGTLVIAQPTRDMRIWSMAESEGDLQDLQYNRIELFQELREQGYDGVLINDFAQSEEWGNLGHLSVGLFPEAISGLSTDMRPATYHEFEMGHFHTPEYPEGPVSDFRTLRDRALQPNVDDLRDIARRDREAKRIASLGDRRSPAERRWDQLEAAGFPKGVDYEALILEEDEENEEGY